MHPASRQQRMPYAEQVVAPASLTTDKSSPHPHPPDVPILCNPSPTTTTTTAHNASAMIPTILLLLLLLLPLSHCISPQSRRIQTTFTLLTNTTICPSSITHTRIRTFSNINPSNPSGTYDGFLWDTLLLSDTPCQQRLTQPRRQSTFLRTRATPPPGTPPDAADPFFLEGRDNSPRLCATFNASFPWTYLFTDDLPTFRDRFVADGYLDPGLATSPVRGVVYMFALPADDAADVVGRACAYVERDDEPAPSPPAEVPDMPACFPATALAYTPTGGRAIAHLAVGDVVYAPTGAERVLSFTHAADTTADFLELRTANGSIVITKGHLLPVNGRVAAAGSVKKGDFLHRVTGSVKVTHVTTVRRDGLYAPVTSSGYMVVDGFVVSCYTDVFGDVVAHALLSPVRGISWMLMWDCAGVVDSLRRLWWG